MLKLIFGMQINIEVSQKLMLSIWVCIVRHAQSAQNNKFPISLQYLEGKVKDEVDFWHTQLNIERFLKLILSFSYHLYFI